MAKLVREYHWKRGIPRGIDPVTSGTGYKIVSDPYYKRVAIERYREHEFQEVIYDSALLNFRQLKPEYQLGWQKLQISETLTLIRDQYDRVALLEEYQFENGFCRQCVFRSPQRLLLGTQKIHFEHMGDAFNGVSLYDANEHLVIRKKYTISEELEFTDLLEETCGALV